ncbi:hypothetical protein RYX36_003310, partial [Vicia faba]
QQQPKSHTLNQNLAERYFYLEKLGIANGFPSSNFEEAKNISSAHSPASSNKLSAISRAQVSAPPENFHPTSNFEYAAFIAKVHGSAIILLQHISDNQFHQQNFVFHHHQHHELRRINNNSTAIQTQQQPKSHTLNQNLAERDFYMEKLGIANGFPSSNFEEAENISSAHSPASSNKLSAISRAQVSAPPGFSIP